MAPTHDTNYARRISEPLYYELERNAGGYVRFVENNDRPHDDEANNNTKPVEKVTQTRDGHRLRSTITTTTTTTTKDPARRRSAANRRCFRVFAYSILLVGLSAGLSFAVCIGLSETLGSRAKFRCGGGDLQTERLAVADLQFNLIALQPAVDRQSARQLSPWKMAHFGRIALKTRVVATMSPDGHLLMAVVCECSPKLAVSIEWPLAPQVRPLKLEQTDMQQRRAWPFSDVGSCPNVTVASAQGGDNNSSKSNNNRSKYNNNNGSKNNNNSSKSNNNSNNNNNNGINNSNYNNTYYSLTWWFDLFALQAANAIPPSRIVQFRLRASF